MKRQMQQVLPRIHQAIESFLEIQVTVAVGKTVGSLEELPDSFAKTKSALEYKFILGGNQTIHAEEFEKIRNSAKHIDIFEWASGIATSVRTNKFEEIDLKSTEFIEQIKLSYVNKNRSVMYVQNLVLSVINLLELPEEMEEAVYEQEKVL